jgi:hypothetical protein
MAIITSRNDTTINASKDTFTQGTTSKSWNESITLASTTAGANALDSIANNMSLALGAGMSRSKSDTSSTTYNNSTLSAESGTIKINSIGTTASGNQTGGDTTLKGANLLGQDITLNVGNNLDVESLQNSYLDKSKSFGMNLGGGGGSRAGSGSVNAGINYSSNKTDRLWVDDQTTIIGTNSVTINVANNTNIAGAAIANSTNGIIGEGAIDGGNLTINTGSLTYSNLQDHDYHQSSGFGISTNIGTGVGRNNGSGGAANNTIGQGIAPATNPNQQNNYYPNGSTTLSAQSEGYKKEQTTKATIGNGNITIGSTQTFDANGNPISSTGGTTNDPTQLAGLNRDIEKTQKITKDTITGALNTSITIDNRLLVAAYETLSGKELTDEEKKAGKKTQGQLLLDEQKNMTGNTIITGMFVGTGIKDVVTSIGDIDPNDPKNDSYFEVLSNKQKLRSDSIFNLSEMLKESKNAKFYNNPDDNKDGYRDPKTGEIFINLARAQDQTEEGKNQFLLNLTLHETAHGDSSYDTISKQTEEGLVRNQTATAADLINFYHNTGNYSDSTASSLTSWAYSNSSVADQYNLGSNALNNLYSNSTQNVTPQLIANNNAIAVKADESRIEPDVAFQINRSGAGNKGHMSGYFQDEFGYWYKYDQGMTEEAMSKASPIGVLLNLGYEAGVNIDLQKGDKNEITRNLINDSNVVYIRTTQEQDKKIFDAAFESRENPGTYRLCTSNCVDAVQKIFSAGNVNFPTDFNPVPNSYFDYRLKPYYPDNKLNQSYDK